MAGNNTPHQIAEQLVDQLDQITGAPCGPADAQAIASGGGDPDNCNTRNRTRSHLAFWRDVATAAHINPDLVDNRVVETAIRILEARPAPTAAANGRTEKAAR